MLTSKERLLRCIRHQPIDRVPVSTYELVGWNRHAWENNEKSYMKLMDNIREYTDCIFMAAPHYKAKSADTVEISEWDEGESHFTKKVIHTPRGDLSTLERINKGIYTVWTLEHLLKDINDIDKLLSIPYEAAELDLTHFYKAREELGEKGLMMLDAADPFGIAAGMFEMGTFLVLAITEPEKIKNFCDILHERNMYNLKNVLKNDVKDVLFRIIGPEYATPPYLSPEYFSVYVTPYLSEMCRVIKEAGAIPRVHSHGKIGKVLGQLAVTEAEAIDPIEPPPDGDIELSEVKRLYGEKFCLFGNIELKEMENSNRERIDHLVYKSMEDAKQGSGFVLMPTSAPITVPLAPKMEENYLQMIESAHKYGKY